MAVLQPFQEDQRATQGNRRWWWVVATAARDWSNDKAPKQGAALAYFTVFSIAPLLIIAMAIAGWAFGADAVQSRLAEQLQQYLGAEGAEAVQSMIVAADKPVNGGWAALLSVGALILGASGVFAQLKDALNTVWEVRPKPGQGIWGYVRSRLFSFAMVMTFGFLLLVTLLVSAALAAAMNSVRDLIPGPDAVAQLVDVLVSLLIVSGIFALMFKYVPDAIVAWKDVWFGALATGLLFTLGKYAISVYLGTTAVASSYGAAGSIVIVMLWAYYSALIVFFGAELTQAYARFSGSRIVPSENAESTADE